MIIRNTLLIQLFAGKALARSIQDIAVGIQDLSDAYIVLQFRTHYPHAGVSLYTSLWCSCNSCSPLCRAQYRLGTVMSFLMHKHIIALYIVMGLCISVVLTHAVDSFINTILFLEAHDWINTRRGEWGNFELFAIFLNYITTVFKLFKQCKR